MVGRTAKGVLLGAWLSAAACSTSNADDGGALGPASTGSSADADASTSSTTNLTTPTTGISASAGPPDTTTGDGSSSTGGSESTAVAGTSTDSGQSTGPMCPDPPTEGSYTQCIQGFFCPGGGTCLQGPGGSFQVCTRGCFDVCNCWPKPDDESTAVPACRDDVLASGALTCVLDCSGGATCPAGGYCQTQFDVCVFDPPAEGSSSGDPTGTGTTEP
jgi:hypothetical protein